jgi:hypothetical protein
MKSSDKIGIFIKIVDINVPKDIIERVIERTKDNPTAEEFLKELKWSGFNFEEFNKRLLKEFTQEELSDVLSEIINLGSNYSLPVLSLAIATTYNLDRNIKLFEALSHNALTRGDIVWGDPLFEYLKKHGTSEQIFNLGIKCVQSEKPIIRVVGDQILYYFSARVKDYDRFKGIDAKEKLNEAYNRKLSAYRKAYQYELNDKTRDPTMFEQRLRNYKNVIEICLETLEEIEMGRWPVRGA